MKGILIGVAALFATLSAFSQEKRFPQYWIGNWKGELQWYRGAAAQPQVIPMELHIQPTDSAHKYSWQIIYGKESEDNRPYTLIAKDSAKGHWAIDENNGIVLDQFLVGGRFTGAFTVGNSTIVNSYWLENGKLMVEFHGLSAKPLATTGKGTEESPTVDSYRVGSWQRAALSRQ